VTWKGIIREFKDFLPPIREESIVTILEGNTPLIETKKLRDVIDKKVKLFLKYEGLNPTGSFKDRGMTLAVSKAYEEGAKAVICASTGNTSAAAGAYAARAGMKAFVIIPEGKIAQGKLSQAIIHGAKVIQVKGNFDDALCVVKEISQNYPVALVNSLNPFRIEGQKTAAFEISRSLQRSPDFHFLPVGNAGNITAYWKGYKEFKEAGKIEALPRMMGFQAEGAAPIVRGHVVEKPSTVASAIRIGNPASWKAAEAARDESGGVIDMVSDDEIIHAYRLLADLEGVFCEPASATSVAGLIKMSKSNIFNDGDVVVCTLTGHGLKDPDTAIKSCDEPISLPIDIKMIVNAMGF
jgi:threonine synthase